MNQNVFITGGSGFIGRHIIDALIKNNFEVFVLTRNKATFSPELGLAEANILVGDINNISNFSEIISTCNYFIHNAGEKSDPKKMKEVNIGGMISVLSELKKHSHIKLISISSAGIYGIEKHTENIIDEKSICQPNNEYERTKFEAEQTLIKFAEKESLKYVILRPTNVFGEHDKSKKLLNFFISLKQKRFFYLDKSSSVNYIYVKFLSSTIIHILNSNLFSNEIFNMNSPCNIEEFVETSKFFLDISDKTKSLPAFPVRLAVFFFDILPKRFQLVNSIKYRELTNKKIYSIQKLKQVITLDEKKILHEGIQNLINHYQTLGLL